MARRNLLFLSSTIIGLLLFVSLLGVILFKSVGINQFLRKDLNEQKQTEILQKMFERNNVAQYTSALSSRRAGGVSAEAADAMIMRAPGPDDSNYFYYKTISNYGPSKDRCEVLKPYNDQERTRESYSFYDESTGYRSKDLSLDDGGAVITYHLSTPSGDYAYYGGKYAVFNKLDSEVIPFIGRDEVEETSATDVPVRVDVGKTDSTAEISVPEDQLTVDPGRDTPKTVTEYMEMMFSGANDYNITQDLTSQDYIITLNYTTSCEINYELLSRSSVVSNDVLAAGGEELVYIHHVDHEDFSIYKTEIYYGSVSSVNLISIVETESDSSKSTFESVANKFEFDLNVRLEQMPDVNYDSEFNDFAKAELTANYDRFLLSADPAWQVLSVNPVKYFDYDYAPYLNDREFYRDDEIGKSMYDQEIKIRKESKNYITTKLGAEVLFSKNVDDVKFAPEQAESLYSFSLWLFDRKYDDITVAKDVVGAADTQDVQSQINPELIGNTQITVNGAKIQARYYRVSQPSIAGSSPGGAGIDEVRPVAPEIEVMDYYTYVIVFEIEGNQYAISYGSTNQTSAELLPEFTVHSFSDTNAVNELFK